MILLGWLMIHFFVFTIVTRWIRLTAWWLEIVWLWKEILVGGAGLVVVWFWFASWRKKCLQMHQKIWFWELIFLLGIIATAGFSLLIHGQLAGEYFLAFKYDFLWFVIFFIWYHLWYFLSPEQRKNIFVWYVRLIKIALVAASVWYMIIFIKPGVLKYFGYSTAVFEWKVGQQPPATYYTHLNQWLPRNQFLFERPISRGFFLIAFWPLFFVLVIRKKSFEKTRVWRFLYTFNVIVTFSRAARWAWIAEVFILWLISQRKSLFRFWKYVILPLFLVLGLIGYLGREQIFYRDYSNTGHIKMVAQWIEKISQKPRFGRWAWFAGPASHQTEINTTATEYNPENQFLQIILEFGFIGFLFRWLLFGRLIRVGFSSALSLSHKSLVSSESTWLLLSMSAGLLWLAICGLVLHSFTDRMIVYPFMALFGLILTHYFLEKNFIKK